MGEYLRTHRSELGDNEIDTQAELERSILCGSTIRSDGTIERRMGIRSRTARKWLNRLGYKWKDVQKGIFFDGHEREDVVEYREIFLEEMKALLPYFVEFKEDGTILPKEYLDDCAVGDSDRRPIIMITHDESTFSANDSLRKVWTLEGHGILRPKGKGRDIMVSDFLLPWSRPNLLSLSLERQQELVSSGIPIEAVTYFECGKMEEGYWTGEHLLDQIKSKALPIAEDLYPGYELPFMFDNATSHAIYAKDALQVMHVNKGPGGQQPFLRAGWYQSTDGEIVTQEMHTLIENPSNGQSQKIQKGAQAILDERGLWPAKGVRLSCDQPKCANCQTLTLG